jgi:DNA invertase Pin-like site-specific DNA recombinase
MKIVTYTRVSTKRQGQSGLGLEAQEAAIQNYIQEQSADVVGGFVEIESGKKSNRVELAKAIALAKKTKSKLVVAKLDRLARNLHFISGLLQSKVDFVALDFPEANTFTIQIMAALAEQEARLISERTKAALAAAKRRGVILGEHGRKLADENIASADKWAASISDSLLSVIASCRKKTLQNVANKLNKKGITTRTGKTLSLQVITNYR